MSAPHEGAPPTVPVAGATCKLPPMPRFSTTSTIACLKQAAGAGAAASGGGTSGGGGGGGGVSAEAGDASNNNGQEPSATLSLSSLGSEQLEKRNRAVQFASDNAVAKDAGGGERSVKIDLKMYESSCSVNGGKPYMSHDKSVARPPAQGVLDLLRDRKHEHPPPLVELYCLNPEAKQSRTALHGVPLLTLLRRSKAAYATLRQREIEEHHALERQAPRPYKDGVMLQSTGVKRMRVTVQRQWLLQFPMGGSHCS